ncbi:MAG TPA: sigma-70 family RNA polymerase sigma factor [Verrucomicrobiae bacterium]|nr:sigma-70 family RNA polymerase sigma factor [Verrucomicrobiae bacterium]
MASTTGSRNDSGKSPSPVQPARQPAFVTTHWSVILTAGRSDTTRARDALARLCQIYWYPLYAYVRHRGYPPHDAQDLTQEFFTRLLERRSFASANPARGKFRSFILAAMNNFLAGEWKKNCAEKRGGGRLMFSLDLAAAEERFEPADDSSPDKIFDRQWALTLLSEVLSRLESEYQSEGKGELFAALKQTLLGTRESQPYSELARELAMTENAVKIAVHRLRKRYRELIHDEIANTLDGGNVEEEMRHLFRALAQ